jgi:Zn2+/Cd2+-exporting ATPase
VMQLSGLGLQGQIGGKLATIGSHSLFEEQHPHGVELCEMIDAAENLGQTTMMVCDGDRVRGFIAVADELRPESQRVIAELHRLGIQTAMLTGDNPAAARGVALPLGIDTIRAGLLPEDKVQVVKELMRSSGSLAMVGDGINDTPALAEATLGVAMGGAGSDQAMETADIVLMDGSLTRLPFAVRLARKARFLVRENVVFSLTIKLVFILLALSGNATMWMAVAADMGVSLLVTLNGLRPLTMKE